VIVNQGIISLWCLLIRKYILRYSLKLYKSTCCLSEGQEVRKYKKLPGFFCCQVFINSVYESRAPPSIARVTKQMEGEKHKNEKFSRFFQNFDNFRKTSSPSYERENQALFTTAFMQRGGDPLWN
jgi:hypothetical protein